MKDNLDANPDLTAISGRRARNVPGTIYFKLDPREPPLLYTSLQRIQILFGLGQPGFPGGSQTMRGLPPLQMEGNVSGLGS